MNDGSSSFNSSNGSISSYSISPNLLSILSSYWFNGMIAFAISCNSEFSDAASCAVIIAFILSIVCSSDSTKSCHPRYSVGFVCAANKLIVTSVSNVFASSVSCCSVMLNAGVSLVGPDGCITVAGVCTCGVPSSHLVYPVPHWYLYHVPQFCGMTASCFCPFLSMQQQLFQFAVVCPPPPPLLVVVMLSHSHVDRQGAPPGQVDVVPGSHSSPEFTTPSPHDTHIFVPLASAAEVSPIPHVTVTGAHPDVSWLQSARQSACGENIPAGAMSGSHTSRSSPVPAFVTWQFMNASGQLSVAGVPDGSSGSQEPSAPHTNPSGHSDVSPTKQQLTAITGATSQESTAPTPKYGA